MRTILDKIGLVIEVNKLVGRYCRKDVITASLKAAQTKLYSIYLGYVRQVRVST